MDGIRWGIIGCGAVTEVKSGPALQQAQDSELVAVMRRNGALARDYAQRHQVPRWYDDAEALLQDPEVNAIYIATPPAFHAPYAIRAAEAGKHIYVEKPMALNHAECQQMMAAAQANGVQLYVAYYRRYLPLFQKVKALLEAGAIGTAAQVQVFLARTPNARYHTSPLPWRVQPELSGGGLFVDMGSHQIDLLQYLLGPIARVSGQATNLGGHYPAEDHVMAQWTHAPGISVSGTWDFQAPAPADEIIIQGSEGQLSFATFAPAPLVWQHQDTTQSFTFDALPHVQLPMVQAVVNAFLGKGSCSSDGESAGIVNWVIDHFL